MGPLLLSNLSRTPTLASSPQMPSARGTLSFGVFCPHGEQEFSWGPYVTLFWVLRPSPWLGCPSLSVWSLLAWGLQAFTA